MDYKEKYKMAFERARKNYDVAQDLCNGSQIGVECFKNTLTNIFPELAESEDEKIRKEIIEYIKTGTYHKNWIAWLEKQGEQKPFDYEHATITQKDFAPKEDPKFHEGDWVASNICNSRDLLHIIDVDDNNYEVETPQGNTGVPSLAYVDNHYHLWTIEDAKPGDVLVNGSNIFIFHFLNDTRLMGYCHVNTNDGRFYDDIGKNECFCLIDAVVTPATKEQRDLLFQKMKEAGYEWDAEKKELKEIKNELEIPFGAYDSELQEVTYYIPKGFHAEIDDEKIVIKKGEKPIAWREEDECMLEDCIDVLYSSNEYGIATLTKMENWLDSLKARIL